MARMTTRCGEEFSGGTLKWLDFILLMDELVIAILIIRKPKIIT